MNDEIDELCSILSVENIKDLTSAEEFENLSYSQNTDLYVLINSTHLRNSTKRYRRYLEYTSISTSSLQELEIIRLLILDFLFFKNWYNASEQELKIQAAKCKSIDMLILNYINDWDTESMSECADSF